MWNNRLSLPSCHHTQISFRLKASVIPDCYVVWRPSPGTKIGALQYPRDQEGLPAHSLALWWDPVLVNSSPKVKADPPFLHGSWINYVFLIFSNDEINKKPGHLVTDENICKIWTRFKYGFVATHPGSLIMRCPWLRSCPGSQVACTWQRQNSSEFIF